ncbi:MAG: endonuclease III [Myxococcales bacterium]|nr:MAG: endonuclease III [Myxococcales bacterium]
MSLTVDPNKKEQARRRAIASRLKKTIEHPKCELDFSSPWQLLVAVILSAQSTDKGVNRVTPELFRRWPKPKALAEADRSEVEQVIRPTGFYKNKTKSICGASQIIACEFDSEVPRTMEDLLNLPGVARKTANVVLGTAFGIASGMTIDTHAGRVARRLGLTHHDNPVKVEADLCAIFAKHSWVDLGHRLVLHGRYVCLARKPQCALCPLNELCPSAAEKAHGSVKERQKKAYSLMVEQHHR